MPKTLFPRSADGPVGHRPIQNPHTLGRISGPPLCQPLCGCLQLGPQPWSNLLKHVEEVALLITWQQPQCHTKCTNYFGPPSSKGLWEGRERLELQGPFKIFWSTVSVERGWNLPHRQTIISCFVHNHFTMSQVSFVCIFWVFYLNEAHNSPAW